MSNRKRYFLLHKPYKVLSQFTDENGNPGLKQIVKVPNDVYPVGRLDLDSEGLLLLTNDRQLNSKLLDPKRGHKRRYWVEVEGKPSLESIAKLERGLEIKVKSKRYKTLPARCKMLKDPISIEERCPPVNHKKHPVRSWLEIEIVEGKNRQVRKMTAKIGHPTLRLIRISIQELRLNPLKSGEIMEVTRELVYKKLGLIG
ncbi:MAG: pseudouridine synthase [Bacteroidota bacterium]